MQLNRVVCLSGGVGGARLVHGLAHALAAEQLTVVVNTADDFTHWGLSISPDLDTVMYTLADLADVGRGWGLADDTFAALAMVQRYGGDDWFQLGDRDLATHVLRTQALREGRTLTQITDRLRMRLAIGCRILPMSDQPCETMIDTDAGTLAFQQWLVRARGEPLVRKVWFRGDAAPSAEVCAAIDEADLIVFGPSNPYVSIDPIMRLPGIDGRLRGKRVVAVSPIVHGQAVKGPLATMLRTLADREPSPQAIVEHYGSLLSGIVVERGDESGVHGCAVLPAATLMSTRERSLTLAREVLAFAATLAASS